jgi:hypothetical protein
MEDEPMKYEEKFEDGVWVRVVDPEELYGGCPQCGKCDGLLYIEREEWAVCHTHRIKWLVACGGWSPWDIPREEYRENWERIKDYTEILACDAVMPPDHN